MDLEASMSFWLLVEICSSIGLVTNAKVTYLDRSLVEPCLGDDPTARSNRIIDVCEETVRTIAVVIPYLAVKCVSVTRVGYITTSPE